MLLCKVVLKLSFSNENWNGLTMFSKILQYQTSLFWYSGHGGETDVSLDCGRFYWPFVRPRMRMSERVNEWVKEIFFFNFRKSGAHGVIILTGENRRTRRKTCPSAILSTTNPTGLTRARTQAAAVRGRRLTAWDMARPQTSSYSGYLFLNCFIRTDGANLIGKRLWLRARLKRSI
jgi:hypothetical protein